MYINAHVDEYFEKQKAFKNSKPKFHMKNFSLT